MNVILLEKIRNFGNLGDQISVKPGFARNYLYPMSKAVPATVDNISKFEARRAELERHQAQELAAAQSKADTIHNLSLVIAAKVGEEGKLFGSLGTRDIVSALKQKGIEVEKSMVQLPSGPIRQVGEYTVDIILHTDVTAVAKVSVVGE